jgi:hypothetical protein
VVETPVILIPLSLVKVAWLIPAVEVERNLVKMELFSLAPAALAS